MTLTEFNSPSPAARIIPHRFACAALPHGCCASEVLGQFAAAQCGRQAVTARFLIENPDLTGYLFDAEDDACGLDPWRVVECDGNLRTGQIVLYWNNAHSEREVDPTFEVYVSRKALERAGFVIPARTL